MTFQTSAGTRSRRNGQITRSGRLSAIAARSASSSPACWTMTSCPAARSSIQTRWVRPLNAEQSSMIRIGCRSTTVRGEGRVRASMLSTNRCPRGHAVRACSWGPSVLSSTKRSTTAAALPHCGHLVVVTDLSRSIRSGRWSSMFLHRGRERSAACAAAARRARRSGRSSAVGGSSRPVTRRMAVARTGSWAAAACRWGR